MFELKEIKFKIQNRLKVSGMSMAEATTEMVNVL